MRILLGILTFAFSSLAFAAEKASFPRMWFYADIDFHSNQRTDAFLDLMRRAKAAGYNGVVLHDARISRPTHERPPQYWKNLDRTRELSEQLEVELISCIAPLSYSNGLLGHDPHLAEGVPVKDCLFAVAGGQANVADRSNHLSAVGDCERFDPSSRPSDWDFVDGPNKSLFQDNEVKHSGESSVRMEKFHEGSQYGLCRMFKKLELKPWHEYHFSVWIRTNEVARPETIRVIMHADVQRQPRFDLNLRPLNVRPTQEWTKHEFVFNTFEHREVWFYIGTWGAESGTIWIDDIRLQEVAGINLLRRDGCPIQVTSEDGMLVYKEGQDFEYWHAPEMGLLPYPGIYRVHPEPPIALLENSRIQDGQKLKVSFYHTQEILNGSVIQCLSHPRVFEFYEQQIRLIRKVFPKTKTYLLKQDEVRLVGWCGLCNNPDQTSGNLLAKHVRQTTDLVRQIHPEAQLVIWSDMFDPYHNAVERYWHARGPITNSWEGLDKDILIGNWNQGKMRESLKWFNERGHRQVIATYFDRSNWQTVVTNWLNTAQEIENIEGIIYTTWNGDYQNLEAFSNLVRTHGQKDSP